MKGIIGHFAKGQRILAWDLWNEPDNGNEGAYGRFDPRNKAELVAKLLPQVYAWARSMDPVQPLTSGIWAGDWATENSMSTVARIQVNESDIISFHNYGWPENFERRVVALQRYHRPMICTEYMARGAGSTFDQTLPIARKYKVGAINWGWLRARRKLTCPGIRGGIHTFSISRLCGSMRCSGPMELHIANERSRSFGASPAPLLIRQPAARCTDLFGIQGIALSV